MILLDLIREKMIDSVIISELIGNRLYAYTAGENDTQNLHAVIIPVDVPRPERPVSNNYLAESHILQVDVEGGNLLEVKTVQTEVRKIMHQLGLHQQAGGLDGYFPETNHYVDSRTYEGIPIQEYFKKTII